MPARVKIGSSVSKTFGGGVSLKGLAALTVVLALAAFAVSARGWFASSSPAKEANTAKHKLPAQAPPSRKGVLNARLSVEPEVNRMRRRLGKHFSSEGNTTTEMVARLSVGSQQRPVRIIRGFNESGEMVVIDQGVGSPALTWSDANGATVNGAPAAGETRAQIERLALDSPDQFVLAKLRGTVYQIVARNVRPSDAGGGSDYKGPLWNLAQTGEPQRSPDKTPLSVWRQYYINASTGLIDRVLSQESGQIITAEITDWMQQGGETFPGKITWLRQGQVLMELSVSAVIFKPRQ